ncbi:phosphopantetheine-binding protein [Rhizobium sp. BR 362]
MARRLHSLAATELLVALEQNYGLDFATADFDISRSIRYAVSRSG